MRKVLESDLSDDSSFANRVADDRYRDFATAFNFLLGRKDSPVGHPGHRHGGSLHRDHGEPGRCVTTETNYFNAMMNEVGSADALLNNDRLRSYLLTSFDIDERYYDRSLIRGVLSSDTSDPSSYINQKLGPQRDDLNTRLTDANTRLAAATDAKETAAIKTEIAGYEASLASIQKYYDMADAFQFNADARRPRQARRPQTRRRPSTRFT